MDIDWKEKAAVVALQLVDEQRDHHTTKNSLIYANGETHRQALRVGAKAQHVKRLQAELITVKGEQRQLEEDNAKQSKRISELEKQLKQINFGKVPPTNMDLIICDGCNVRGPNEHRCHRFPITRFGVKLIKACECLACREADRISMMKAADYEHPHRY